MKIKLTQAARRARIGSAHIAFVIENNSPGAITNGRMGDRKYHWIGKDTTGRQMEIIAILMPDKWLVIHVMPTHYRGREFNGSFSRFW